MQAATEAWANLEGKWRRMARGLRNKSRPLQRPILVQLCQAIEARHKNFHQPSRFFFFSYTLLSRRSIIPLLNASISCVHTFPSDRERPKCLSNPAVASTCSYGCRSWYSGFACGSQFCLHAVSVSRGCLKLQSELKAIDLRDEGHHEARPHRRHSPSPSEFSLRRRLPGCPGQLVLSAGCML